MLPNHAYNYNPNAFNQKFNCDYIQSKKDKIQ